MNAQPSRLLRQHHALHEQHEKAREAGQAFLIAEMDKMIDAATKIQVRCGRGNWVEAAETGRKQGKQGGPGVFGRGDG